MRFLLIATLRWTIEDDVGDDEKCEQEFSEMFSTPFTSAAKDEAKKILRKIYEEHRDYKEFSIDHAELYSLKKPILISVQNKQLNFTFSR